MTTRDSNIVKSERRERSEQTKYRKKLGFYRKPRKPTNLTKGDREMLSKITEARRDANCRPNELQIKTLPEIQGRQEAERIAAMKDVAVKSYRPYNWLSTIPVGREGGFVWKWRHGGNCRFSARENAFER
jgi:hypothetical protein